MKKYLFYTATIFTLLNSSCNSDQTPEEKRPKLVVGIIVDQMRYDYLAKFYNKYKDGGFKRLLKNGYSLQNAHFNYVPTYTAVGHTSVFTGTTPKYHGIIGNRWYDKELKKSIYCVNDNNYESVGVSGNSGKKSPHRLYTTTIADQLKLAQNTKGKTIGIAIKDRSAILPVGHTADAAYWFEGGSEGKWITSSYYMKSLPKWVNEFNNSDVVKNYLKTKWETSLPISEYYETIDDDNDYEKKFKGEKKPVFPHDIPNLSKSNHNFSILKYISHGNSITTEFVKSAILGENLGNNNHTDFLSISFSSTDYVGHLFGPASKEIEDTYIKLDEDLAIILNFLDSQVGKNNYTLFLTADHGVTHIPKYLTSLKIPSGYINSTKLQKFAGDLSKDKFGSEEIIENVSTQQIFLDRQKMRELKLDYNIVSQYIADELLNFKDVYKTITARTLQNTYFSDGIFSSIQRGYNQKLSGDIMIITTPSILMYDDKSLKTLATSHGTGYNYDTHVPVIFYGKGIKKGVSSKYYPIIDIAPTISNLIDIEFTNGNTGKVISEVLK